MFPFYVLGVGWVFQPVVPISPGCVYAPVEQPKTFGFRLATIGSLALLVLVWLSLTHPVEVIGAILAAVALEAVLRLGHGISRTLRRRRNAKKGGWPWA
ncbi:hypothetical protein [Streptomyces sp. NBC_00094]|uniref:hypothetical protein n=1 Tax=Streptomyces sp. NBC_00094 TaxID=2903620 RepID=UPI00224F5D5A|nr:hypothetical protein [Streptomyces sp. NBC_00094]MCX5395385.1 hypothetical protein [Streptomyces sp. NBC_00094]